jgi:hypothetical protein
MEQTSRSGLAGLSTKKALVFGRTAFFQASRSVASTKVTSTPNLGIHSATTQRHEPNTARAEIM